MASASARKARGSDHNQWSGLAESTQIVDSRA
jgi:hypothetical protein